MVGDFRVGPWLVRPGLNVISKDGNSVHLEPKVMEVLVCLAKHPGETVLRTDLLQTVWLGAFVTDDALKRCIFELRRAFNDDASTPDVIETIPKRGYRMIATVSPVLEEAAALPQGVSRYARILPATPHSVGRKKERAELTAAFESVAAGRGMLACIAGEPGIGKTTLVQDLLSALQGGGRSFGLAIGRCSQRLAGEEAYLLENLFRNNGGYPSKLRELAPSWYARLFPLSQSDPSDARLQEYARTATQERVKREMAAFLQEITRETPLVLFFDDVHWTDPSTVDLLAYLGTKFDSTKVLVIAAFRPSELLLLKHPFIGVKRELRARSLCREIAVEFLSAGDVEEYIALEFLGQSFPRDFAELIHARTEGNPLFMVDVLRYLRDRKVIVKAEEDGNWRLARSLPDLSRDIPQSVSSVIDRKIDQLGDRDREVLTAAAVQGYEFDSASLAQGLAAGSLEIEEILARLERVHAFVRRVGEEVISGGPQTVQYRFVHVLYQNALYASLTPTRRITLSAALAHALEAMYGDRSSAIASQLAFLYETAREAGRASDYFLLAAQNAQNIFAHPEAIALTRRGLALLDQIPGAAERMPKELGLQITLAFSLMCTLGYAAPETGTAMRRSHELCQAAGNNAALCPILWGLGAFYLCAGNIKSAREVAEHMLIIAQQLNDRVLLMGSRVGLATSRLHQGELVGARGEFEEVERLYDVAQHSRYVQLYQFDPGVHSTAHFTRLLWLLGYPDQACRKAEDALGLARTLSSPLSLAFLKLSTAQLAQHLRQPEKSREMAQACIALCDEQGIQLERAWAHCWHGWALTKLGETDAGISEIRSGIEAQLSVGSHVGRSYILAVLADALWQAQRLGEGLEAVEEGLASSRRNEEPFYDAELWRLKGELLQAQGKTAEGEACFQKAIEIARQQAAKSVQLRASTSLARLWQKQGKRTEARHLLSEIYAWFTEGFDTADLQEAKSLLEELGAGNHLHLSSPSKAGQPAPRK